MPSAAEASRLLRQALLSPKRGAGEAVTFYFTFRATTNIRSPNRPVSLFR